MLGVTCNLPVVVNEIGLKFVGQTLEQLSKRISKRTVCVGRNSNEIRKRSGGGGSSSSRSNTKAKGGRQVVLNEVEIQKSKFVNQLNGSTLTIAQPNSSIEHLQVHRGNRILIADIGCVLCLLILCRKLRDKTKYFLIFIF